VVVVGGVCAGVVDVRLGGDHDVVFVWARGHAPVVMGWVGRWCEWGGRVMLGVKRVIGARRNVGVSAV